MRVELGNILMIMRKHIMYFKLTRELLDHIIFYNCGLEYLLQSKNRSSFFMSANMNISKFSRSYTFSQLKASHWEFSFVFWSFLFRWVRKIIRLNFNANILTWLLFNAGIGYWISRLLNLKSKLLVIQAKLFFAATVCVAAHAIFMG